MLESIVHDIRSITGFKRWMSGLDDASVDTLMCFRVQSPGDARCVQRS